MGRIIGIDLGTTTSEIAYIQNGKPEIIVNDIGSRITPSVVGLSDENDIIVGITAKRQFLLKPDRTVLEIKRLIGSSEKILLDGKLYTPTQISSMIIAKLKCFAEDFLGEEVTKAVITVPANFNDVQRQATKLAGEQAGLRVDRIINEPTAAALAYGINNMSGEEKILVYDLGGGTFDVTVLELYKGVIDVKASRGNNYLGGKDFDDKIAMFIVEKFKSDTGINLLNNKKSMARIKDAAETAKIELSSLESTQIDLPFIAIDEHQNPLEISFKLTRTLFENLIKDFIDSTENEINEALKAAGYSPSDIDVVLAIGGSSRLPSVKRLLNTLFHNKVKSGLNPDEAVALGAAIQAGIINDEISSVNSILVTDTCRYTLGISITQDVGNGKILEGVFSPIILRDSKIPATVSQTYYTLNDDQTSVNIAVYQGDGRLVSENTLIGQFELDGFPPAPAGQESLNVSFSYNMNGILEVSATILSTGKSASKTIDTYSTIGESVLFFDDLIQTSPENAIENCKHFHMVKGTIEICNRKLQKLNLTDRNIAEDLLNKLKKAILNDDERLVINYDTQLTDFLFDIT